MADFSITGEVRLNSDPAEKSTSKWTVAAGQMIADFAKQASSKLAEVVKSGVDYNATMESYLTNFKVMLGSEEAAAKKTSLQVLEGVPNSAGPAAPAITRTELIYDLCLAEIKRPAGSTAVTAADIYDTRADETVCGVMRDGVHGIPTGTLVQQWKAVIESMRGGSFYTRAEVDALLKSLKSVDPFPVGSIYQSTARTSPAALFGGTWQEIAQNRVLMGAGSGHAAGTTVEAGLPNITGSFVADVKKGEHKVSGAFTAGNVIASTGEYNSFSDVYKFSLDASKSNAIYGRSATVQPAAYYVHIWRRVA